jgi:predicted RNase H-like HicB family nuclease
MDAPRYPKHVFWSDDDEGFIAVAPDLPGSSAFGETEAEALAELDQAIDAWIEAARAAGNGVPAPSRPASPSLPSGKVLVRMPRTLHQSLTREADREDVSLNQFMVYVLSRYSEVVAPQRLTAVPTITGGSWEGATGTVTITAGTVRTLKIL